MAKPAKRPLAKPCLGSTSPGSSEKKDLRATKASPFWLRRLRFLKTQIQGRFRKDQRNSGSKLKLVFATCKAAATRGL